jgi:hypothetical protein
MGVLGRASVLVVSLAVLAGGWSSHAVAAEPRPVKLVPPLEGPDVITVAVERDGTRRLISRGLRVLVTTEGEVTVGNQPLPAEKSSVSVELPQRFGGGYLFASAVSGRTALWKARSWAAQLEPFADIDFEVTRIVPGFDRIHLQARRTGEWAALDAETGAGLDRGNLPASPTFGAMAFVDSWFGAVELPVRGTVVSFDAGASWHPLGMDVTSLGIAEGALVLGSERAPQLLAADGRLRPSSGRPVATEASGPARVLREGALGRLPLRTAVLRGIPDGQAAVVLSHGVLARVRLSDGRVLSETARAVPATRECSGARVRDGFGFVCGEARGATEIYSFDSERGLRLVERFDEPRLVAASDNGGLVIAGGCGSSATAAAATRSHCIVTPSGKRFEVSASARGLDRVVALADGRAALIEPPNGDSRGSIRVVDASGKSQAFELVPDPEAENAGSLLKGGFWMQGFVEKARGVLSGWIVGRGSFVGVRVALDGKLRMGSVQRSIESALPSGRHALVLGVSGIAEQTSDGGFTWTDADMPSSVDSDADRAQATAPELEQGCSLVGCVFRRWVRVGWDSFGGKLRSSPPRPPPTVLPSPGGGRWHLECARTGASPPALPTVARRGYGTTAEVPSPWLPLREAAAPSLSQGRVGIDVGTEMELVQLRAYLFGAKAADFPKNAAFLLRVVDRYRTAGGIWSTAASASPWGDLEQALAAFGYEGDGPAGWRLALDPSGTAGVLSVNSRGTTDLFLLERDRAVRRIPNVARHGLGVVTSAVRIGATYYVATLIDTRTFRVFALEAGTPRLVGEYHDVPLGASGPPVLVRTTRHGGLGLWARGAGWYVFAIDERTGASSPAIEIAPRSLATVPRVCSEDEEGFLLEGPVGLEPIVEWNTAARVSALAVEGRFVVTAAGVCVRELAAQADRAMGASARAPREIAQQPAAERKEPRAEVPLVLSDRGELGRRVEFRCTDDH